MKVTRWVSYEEAESNYRDGGSIVCDDHKSGVSSKSFRRFRRIVIRTLKETGIAFDGQYHQYGRYGVPVIDDEFAFMCSYRQWGKVMQMAKGIRGEYGYMDWYMREAKDFKYPSRGRNAVTTNPKKWNPPVRMFL